MNTVQQLRDLALQQPVSYPVTFQRLLRKRSAIIVDDDAANAGFKGILAKPVNQSQFYKLVRQVLTND